MEDQCKLCAARLDGEVTTERGLDCDCPRCGKFTLSGVAKLSDWASYPNSAVLSYTARRMQRQGERPLLSSDQIETILQTQHLPTAREQADNLIIHLGDQLDDPSAKELIDFDYDTSLIGATSSAGVVYVVKTLHRKGLVELPTGLTTGELSNRPQCEIGLTYEGWERYQELRRTVAEGMQAFMAMKFNDPELDRIYERCFKGAVAATGFDLRRLDEGQPAGLIDDQLRVRIRAARFLVADLSHANNGVYWEAGFAEGLGKPVIYTCKRAAFDDAETRPHFDTNHHLTVTWDVGRLDETAEKLKATIRATLPADAKLAD